MHQSVSIANQNIPLVEYQGQRVVTFAMIDQVHQRPARTARRNFDQNKARFIEGEDFYLVDSKGLHEFRVSGVFPESANSGTLFTESGYLMLVKSFNDDLAWQVQRELVQSYFRAKVASKDDDPTRLRFPHLLAGFYKGATLTRITRMERELVGQGVHGFGLTPEQARERALPILQERLGADPAFLFRGLPVIVPEKSKKEARKAKKAKPVVQVDALSVDRSARSANDHVGHPSSDTVFCGAQELAGMIPVTHSTGQPDGQRVNEALITLGYAYRRSDNNAFPRQPQADGLFRMEQVVAQDGRKVGGRFITVWDKARILPILRQHFAEKPKQLQLVTS